MTLDEYEEFVTGLASEYTMKDFHSKLGTAGLGLGGEGGEVADIAKKVLYHGMEWNEEVRQKVIKELGDVLWYVAFAARNVVNMSFEEIIATNVAKLQARYKTGKFSTAEFMEKERNKTE